MKGNFCIISSHRKQLGSHIQNAITKQNIQQGRDNFEITYIQQKATGVRACDQQLYRFPEQKATTMIFYPFSHSMFNNLNC